MTGNDYYAVREAAETLDRFVPTIYRWMNSAKLAAVKNLVTDHYTIPNEDVEEARKRAL